MVPGIQIHEDRQFKCRPAEKVVGVVPPETRKWHVHLIEMSLHLFRAASSLDLAT